MTPSVLLVTLKMQAFWVCPMATSLGEVNPRWCVTKGWSRAGVWIHHVTIDRYVIYTDTLTPGVRDLGLARKGLPFWGKQWQFTRTTHAAKVDRFQCQKCQFSFQLHLKGLWIPKTLRTLGPEMGIIPVPRHTRGFWVLASPWTSRFPNAEVKAPAGTKEKKLAAEIANGRLAPWRVGKSWLQMESSFGAGGHGYKGGPQTWKMPPNNSPPNKQKTLKSVGDEW